MLINFNITAEIVFIKRKYDFFSAGLADQRGGCIVVSVKNNTFCAVAEDIMLGKSIFVHIRMPVKVVGRDVCNSRIFS